MSSTTVYRECSCQEVGRRRPCYRPCYTFRSPYSIGCILVCMSALLGVFSFAASTEVQALQTYRSTNALTSELFDELEDKMIGMLLAIQSAPHGLTRKSCKLNWLTGTHGARNQSSRTGGVGHFGQTGPGTREKGTRTVQLPLFGQVLCAFPLAEPLLSSVIQHRVRDNEIKGLVRITQPTIRLLRLFQHLNQPDDPPTPEQVMYRQQPEVYMVQLLWEELAKCEYLKESLCLNTYEEGGVRPMIRERFDNFRGDVSDDVHTVQDRWLVEYTRRRNGKCEWPRGMDEYTICDSTTGTTHRFFTLLMGLECVGRNWKRRNYWRDGIVREIWYSENDYWPESSDVEGLRNASDYLLEIHSVYRVVHNDLENDHCGRVQYVWSEMGKLLCAELWESFASISCVFTLLLMVMVVRASYYLLTWSSW